MDEPGHRRKNDEGMGILILRTVYSEKELVDYCEDDLLNDTTNTMSLMVVLLSNHGGRTCRM